MRKTPRSLLFTVSIPYSFIHRVTISSTNTRNTENHENVIVAVKNRFNPPYNQNPK